MPQAATHAYASSENHASRQPPPKAAGSVGEATDLVERLLASPPSSGAGELRNEVELLRRVLGEQQRTLRRSFASAAQFEKDATATAAETVKLREAVQKLERELQGEKASHSRDASRTGEQILALNNAVSEAVAVDLAHQREHRRERRLWIAASALTATSALALAVLLWLARTPKAPDKLPKPNQTSATKSDSRQPSDTALELSRVRQALSILPEDAVRRILRDEPRQGPPPGCAVDPREGRMLLRVGKDRASAGALASALANCVEKLEAPLK